MEPQVMRIGDLDVHVTVSDRRRTVRLTIERDATVTAVIPPATDEAKLAKAINAKRPWLYAKLRERAETGTPRPPREFVSGEGFPATRRTRLRLTGPALWLPDNSGFGNMLDRHPGSQAKRRA